MATGFEILGAALGGDSEEAYQEGRALGAKTEEALANARRRVMENDALERGRKTLIAQGVPEPQADAAYTALQAGGKLDDPIQLMLKSQEYGFNQKIADPNVPLDHAQRMVLTKSTNPVEPLYKIGGGYANKFNSAAGIQPLGDMVGDSGGGQSAALQLISEIENRERTARGDPSFQLTPRQAMAIARESQHLTDLGGTPGIVDFLDSIGLSGSPRAFNPAPSPGAAPAPATPAPQAVTPTAAQIAPTSTVASNAAAIASAKEQGQAQGKFASGLPDALADIDKMGENIKGLLAQPGFNKIYGNVQGNPVVAGIQGVADMSNETANAKAALSQLDAQAFGVSIQKMVGLGQLSNAEGLKVTAAFTRATNPSISESEARAAWAEVLSGLEQAKQRATLKAGATPVPPGGQTPAAPAGSVMSLDDYLKSKGF
jgi:hypothetical protein